MVQLQHSFVTGLRFDTEVQYRVLRQQGYGYCRLPVKPPRNLVTAESDGSLFSAIQCVALVCQRPFRWVQRQLQMQGLTNIASLAGSADLRIDNLHVRSETIQDDEAQAIGAAALQAIHEGHVCMVQFASIKGNRWATLVGVEWQSDGQAKSLLLLDSQADEPWACGYNARIDLARSAGASARTRPGCTLRYRSITGDMYPTSVMCLIRIRRVAKA